MRQVAARNKPRIARLATFPAAVKGWLANTNLSSSSPSSQGAVILENIMPTATGGIIRRGSATYATLENEDIQVDALFSYRNGSNQRFFASNATTVYDITNVVNPLNTNLVDDLGNPIVDDLGNQLGQNSTQDLNVINGQTNGKWSVQQFATTGGVYLVMVNGNDPMQIYDGTNWYPIGNYAINLLNFDAQTLAFTPGATVTGGTSGATAQIISIRKTSPTVGTLVLKTITGTFQNNEIVSGGGGSATVDGVATQIFVPFTGVATSDLKYVWAYKNRLFFIEKDSLNAWYLPVDVVGGAAVRIPFGGIFSLGGSLMFGQTWSLDSGNAGGLSEQCIFVTDEGEVAVYQGDNPAAAATWSRVGTYRIGKPLGPKAWIRAGGDLVIDTTIGAIPLSQAIQRDYAALSPSAVSFPIETEWNKAVELRSEVEWNSIVWPERQMFVVALPTTNEQTPAMFIANARTGAWALFKGWSGTCLEVFQGRMFFGSQNGRVVEAYVTGSDEGTPYTATYAPLFSDMGSSASEKVANICRIVTRGPYDAEPKLSVMADYIIDIPSPPSAVIIPGGSQWGVGLWGSAIWGGQESTKIQQHWDSVSGMGYALAPVSQITSGSLIPLDTEIIRMELTYNGGDIGS